MFISCIKPMETMREMYISNVKKDPNQIEGMDAANRKLAQHLGSPDFEKEAFKNPDKPGETMSYSEMRARYG